MFFCVRLRLVVTLRLSFPHFSSLSVIQAVHHCQPTKSRTSSASASHLLPSPCQTFEACSISPLAILKSPSVSSDSTSVYLHPIALLLLFLHQPIPPCLTGIIYLFIHLFGPICLSPTNDLHGSLSIIVKPVIKVFRLSPSNLSFSFCSSLAIKTN